MSKRPSPPRPPSATTLRQARVWIADHADALRAAGRWMMVRLSAEAPPAAIRCARMWRPRACPLAAADARSEPPYTADDLAARLDLRLPVVEEIIAAADGRPGPIRSLLIQHLDPQVEGAFPPPPAISVPPRAAAALFGG